MPTTSRRRCSPAAAVRNVELIRNPLSYLLGIAAHVTGNQAAQAARSDLYDSDLAAELCDNGDDARQGVDFPEQLELRHGWTRHWITSPRRNQLVLLLVKRDGLSYAEAAAAAGLSIHTIEKYVVEARPGFRIILAENAMTSMDPKTANWRRFHAQQASAWLESLRRPNPGAEARFVSWLKESPRNVRDFLIMLSLDHALSRSTRTACATSRSSLLRRIRAGPPAVARRRPGG